MNTLRGLAIVTGASAGIGREIARQLSARGRPVLAVARRAERLEQLAAEARAANTAAIHPFALDVTDAGAPLKLRDRARELGGAAWLVNDAGQIRIGAVQRAAIAEQAGLVRLNCEAPVAICAAIVPDLVARGAGVVLNVASLAGMQPTPFFAAYGASKAFLLSYTEALGEELRGTGVTVTALCPGPVTTELNEASVPGGDADRKKPSHERDAATVARAAIAAAERGAALCIPGAYNRLQSMIVGLAPRALVRRVARKAALGYIGFDPAKYGA